MQATIAGIHIAKNNEEDCAKKMKVGVVWDDDDFKMLGLDAHCTQLVAPFDEIKQRTNRIFWALLKDWKVFDTIAHGDGDVILEQRILM